MKPKDISLVREVLGWDCRGDEEEYRAMEKAERAFERIVQHLQSIEAQLKACQDK